MLHVKRGQSMKWQASIALMATSPQLSGVAGHLSSSLPRERPFPVAHPPVHRDSVTWNRKSSLMSDWK